MKSYKTVTFHENWRFFMKERNINGRIRKIILLSLFVIAIVTMGFSTALGKNVVLNINGQEKNIVTYSKTVEEF